jgi:hypothetical protein
METRWNLFMNVCNGVLLFGAGYPRLAVIIIIIRVKNFLFSTTSRPALGPTQPPIQRIPGSLSAVVK